MAVEGLCSGCKSFIENNCKHGEEFAKICSKNGYDQYIMEKGDMVNHPKHYNVGKYEVIDVIEDWKLNFHIGNAVKYLARAGHKGDEIEDLKKAIWYINRRIENIKKEKGGEKNV